MKCYSKNKGFTLAELLLIIALISLFSSIVIVSATGTIRKLALRTTAIHFEGHLYRTSYPLGIWNFDEGAGNIVRDTSGNNNHGTIHGPAWRCSSEDSENTPSRSGCSLEFNGIDGYVEIPNSYRLNPTGITITMWLYLERDPSCDNNNNWRSILYKGGFSSTNVYSGYDIVLESGPDTTDIRTITFSVGTATGTVKWTSSIAKGGQVAVKDWTFVAVTYDPSETRTKIYFNNGQDLTADNRWVPPGIPEGEGNIAPNDYSIMVSKDHGDICPDGAGNFPGKIDNLRIYEGAISQAEIQKIYAKESIKFLVEEN